MKWALLLVILTGCASPTALPTFQNQPIKIDAQLLEPCAVLEAIQNPDFSEILKSVAINAQMYSECKQRHNSLVKVVKELTNAK